MAKSSTATVLIDPSQRRASIEVPQKEKRKRKKPGIQASLKLERRQRITTAARQLFTELGYDAATLRQIATHAGLGLGTLFNYVTDKRDLIFLIWNEEMDALVDRCLRATPSGHTFCDKILSMTGPQFRVFGKDAKLSRILLSETRLHSPGMHLERYLAIRLRLLRGIEALVSQSLATGEISSNESAELIARHIFFSFSSEVRWWVESPNPDWHAGQAEFERILRLQMDGLSPASGKGKTLGTKKVGKKR